MSGLGRQTLPIRQTMRVVHSLLIGGIVVYSTRNCQAQAITIQQPVVSTFSVDTTVSVPDRGGIYLGGVGQAGSSRKSFGFSRPGTATGTFTQGTSTSVHVWIHDFEAMDQAALNAAKGIGRDALRYNSVNRRALRPEVSHAAGVLRERHVEKLTRAARSDVHSTRAKSPSRGLRIIRTPSSSIRGGIVNR